jgi:acetylornithine/N-succinyldiaminopimelate aminotransferase
MIKFARKWGNPKGKCEIITMENSFHGRTLATLAATGRTKYRKGFGPKVSGFRHVPFNDIEAIKQAVKESNGRTAAIAVIDTFKNNNILINVQLDQVLGTL